MSWDDINDLPPYLRREILDYRNDLFDMNWERY